MKVTGIGGIFFKAQDPEQLKLWYKDHLGIDTLFRWRTIEDETSHYTVWNVFAETANIFDKTRKDYVFNYCVYNLQSLLSTLKDQGVKAITPTEIEENGKFGTILDPDGNKIILWEPSGKEVGPFTTTHDRVTGLGGIFFRTDNLEKIKEWYGKHLGLPIDAYGASIKWIDPNDAATVPAPDSLEPFHL